MNWFVRVMLGLVSGLLLGYAAVSAASISTPPPIAVPVWTHDPIAPDGTQSDIELDAAGNPHVLFIDATTHTLRYARREAGVWVVDDLRPFPNGTPPADLAYDLALNPLDDMPIVAYVDTEEDALYVGSPEDGEWQWAEIGAGGRLLSLRVDAGGGAHLALVAGRVVAYYFKGVGNWVAEQVGDEDDYVWNLSLELDAAGRPHLAGTGANGSFHAYRAGSDDWEVTPLSLKNVEGLVLEPGGEPLYLISEAVAVGGRPPFSLVTLALARREASEWAIAPLWQDYDWYINSDVDIDAAGTIHLIFYDVAARPHYMIVKELSIVGHESPFQMGTGVMGLALDTDANPCLSRSDGANLFLTCREIRFFDEYAFAPHIHR